MDIRMPRLDGLTAIKRIRSHSTGKDLVIIAISASAFDSDQQKILDSGASDFIRKPFKTQRVYKILKESLGLEYLYTEENREDPETPNTFDDNPQDSPSETNPGQGINAKEPSFTGKLQGGGEFTYESKQVPVARRDTRDLPVVDGLLILVVDDNELNTQLCSLQLSKLGHACDCALNGFSAIGAHVKHQYDLILLDYEMPEINGLETAKLIRNWEKANHISPCTIVALSGHAGQPERLLAEAAGMDDFAVKPLKLDGLQKLLEKHA